MSVETKAIRMLSKEHRLTKREDFAAVYSRGIYIGQGEIAIKFLTTRQPESRIGFSIGKNFSKKAVLRNRYRRVLQAVCSLYIQALKPGFDIVILPKPGQGALNFKKVEVILKQIFVKANLLI